LSNHALSSPLQGRTEAGAVNGARRLLGKQLAHATIVVRFLEAAEHVEFFLID
jgi:hypothetical protein